MALGDEAENGEWRFKSKSASDTSTGSGVGTVLNVELGGGMDVGLKEGKEDGDGIAGVSNLMGGFDKMDAIEGCVLVETGLELGGLASREVLSEVYMTATFVDGEFIVPVSDHPMAILISRYLPISS